MTFPFPLDRVALSDASWAPKGNRSGRRYHWPDPDDPAKAACGWFVLDNLVAHGTNMTEDPADVPDYLRCRRRACARRYEELTHAHDDTDPTDAPPAAAAGVDARPTDDGAS